MSAASAPHPAPNPRPARRDFLAAASGTAAVNVTVGYVAGPGDPFESTVADIARWNRIVQSHHDALLKVRTAADIERAARDGKVGIIIGFQNAAMMGADPGRVRTFAGLGARIVQLTYNTANALGRALADLPRNKTDRELRLVAEGGGMVGIYFMPFLAPDGMATAQHVVRHIEHAVQICGEEHVGIGTDGGTTAHDDMEAAREAARRDIEARSRAGIGAAGERAGVVPFIPDLQGPGQFRQLADMLAARGHSADCIDKVLGLNALRVMREVWGV